MVGTKYHTTLLHPEERFTLALVRVSDASGRARVDVPFVSGWAQLNIPVLRVPRAAEQAAFFSTLARLLRRLRRASLIDHWFLLHKAPGLRLRFRSRERGELLARALVEQGEALRASWTGTLGFDSYFEQRELLSGYFEEMVGNVLSLSSDSLVQSVLRARHGDEEGWTRFTVAFLHHFLGDRWWVWEALGRFERMRGVRRAGRSHKASSSPAWKLYDPSRLLQALLREKAAAVPPGFAASTTLLVCLNSIFNQWELEADVQSRVLQKARQVTSPELARP